MSMINHVVLRAIIMTIVLKITKTAKILGVFPTPSISHQVVFMPLMKELVNRGHEVIVITTDPVFSADDRPSNFKEIDMHNISYPFWKEQLENIKKGGEMDIFGQVEAGRQLISLIFNKQFKTEEVQKILNDKNISFDLIIVESHYRMAIALTHRYHCPMILISSFGATYTTYDKVGAPNHPLLYPGALRQKINNLTIWDTVHELYVDLVLTRTVYSDEDLHTELAQKILPGTPTLSELDPNFQMLFLNIHPIWEGLRPVPLNVVYISGIHLQQQQGMSEDLKSYLDTSYNGVIYISFGTNVNTSYLPKQLIQIFVNVLSKLPCNILWKWDSDILPGKTKNVRIAKWWPQNEILNHPNLKLFISQGGLQSTEEAISAGVPLIGIPMLFDQWLNTEKYVLHKIGVKLDIAKINENMLLAAINQIFNDQSYSNNIKKLQILIKDKPFTSLEHAVWWTEHLIQHKDVLNLRSPAASLSWVQYYELDLILSMFLCLIILLFTICYVVRLVFLKIQPFLWLQLEIDHKINNNFCDNLCMLNIISWVWYSQTGHLYITMMLKDKKVWMCKGRPFIIQLLLKGDNSTAIFMTAFVLTAIVYKQKAYANR